MRTRLFYVEIFYHDPFRRPPCRDGSGFLGFVSTTAFSSLLFGLDFASAGVDGEQFVLDNALLALPEPGILMLFAIALAGLGFSRRKRVI